MSGGKDKECNETDLVLKVIMPRGMTKTELLAAIYLFAERFNCNLDFQPHLTLGPYSSRMSNVIEDLVSAELVKVSSIVLPDRRQIYVYESPIDLKGVVDVSEEEVKVANVLADHEDRELLIAAKTHFTSKRMNVKEDEDIVKQAKKFGWTLQADDVKKAKEILAQINLL
ncbi:MAG: hypothetical protein QXI60_03745 [Thermofilaceae archaeon]